MTRLLETLALHATNQPAKAALVGPRLSLTYGGLLEQVGQTAKNLSAYISTDRPVALVCDNSPAWILLDLAFIQLAVPHVPLPPFFTEGQTDHALESTGATIILSDHLIKGRRLVDVLTVAGDQIFIHAVENAAKPLHAGTAKITFTSGTTGQPKGVCLSQAAMEATAEAILDRVGPDAVGRHLPLLPLSVLLENVAGLYAILFAGGTYLAMPQATVGFEDSFRPDFARMLSALAFHKTTSTIMVPELMRGALAVMAQLGNKLSDLRMVAVGGSRVSPVLLQKAKLLGLPVCEGYGLSEAGSVVAMNAPDDNHIGTVGRVLPHVSVSQLDSGELVLDKAPFLGYVGGPAQVGPYRTGDLTRMDEAGRLLITGRAKNILITSFGRNIAPEWVESELLAQKEIAQVLVYGDDRPALGAMIVPTSPTIDETQIQGAINRANAMLPDYARIKHWFITPGFTVANGLLTGTGRPRRTVLLKEKANMIEKSYQNEGATETFFDRLVAATERERQFLLSVPLIQSGMKGAISRETYVAYLTEAYHHVKHTVTLLATAKSHIPSSRVALHDALSDYILEEQGHENWILNDIRNAGGPADEVRTGEPSFTTEMMVAYAYDYVSRINPVGFFGMVFVLEGTSTALATQAAERLMVSLDLPKKCFSYLLSHGSLDLKHMEFFQGLMTQITDPAEQAAIIHMAKRMYLLFAGVFEELGSRKELQHVA